MPKLSTHLLNQGQPVYVIQWSDTHREVVSTFYVPAKDITLLSPETIQEAIASWTAATAPHTLWLDEARKHCFAFDGTSVIGFKSHHAQVYTHSTPQLLEEIKGCLEVLAMPVPASTATATATNPNP